MTREIPPAPLSIDRIFQRLDQEYGPVSEAVKVSIRGMLGMLSSKIGGLDKLVGKTVLDIGCGSNNSSQNRQFEPWLARALLLLGARPIGIDIGDLTGEKFEYHQIDIVQPGALDFLPSQSIDFTVSFLLWGSAEMKESLRESSRSVEEVQNEIRRQITRVTRDPRLVIENG